MAGGIDVLAVSIDCIVSHAADDLPSDSLVMNTVKTQTRSRPVDRHVTLDLRKSCADGHIQRAGIKLCNRSRLSRRRARFYTPRKRLHRSGSTYERDLGSPRRPIVLRVLS